MPQDDGLRTYASGIGDTLLRQVNLMHDRGQLED